MKNEECQETPPRCLRLASILHSSFCILEVPKALLVALESYRPGTTQHGCSPMRAERAKPKSCKDDEIIAQGKRSAALGYGRKMIPWAIIMLPLRGAGGRENCRLGSTNQPSSGTLSPRWAVPLKRAKIVLVSIPGRSKNALMGIESVKPPPVDQKIL